jgi:N-dimethylarginine dimethylaminohydrolase
MNKSEFNTPPLRFVMHHPAHGEAMQQVAAVSLTDINFLAHPKAERLCEEYDGFIAALRQHVPVMFLGELLRDEQSFVAERNANPNLMFCRDSAITLPWAELHFIPSRLALKSREKESAVMARALDSLGLKPILQFSDDEYLEGGDVLPVMHEGKRILLIGFGNRTTKAAALKIAMKAIPTFVDRVIGLTHDPDLLHLDTGFTVLPNNVMFAASGMFRSGFLIDEERRLHDIDPIERARGMGFQIITCEKEDAIEHERCNMLPLGQNVYLAFDMPDDIRETLQAASGIEIMTVAGRELAKAAGGVHCLTRPIYV